MLKSRSLLDVSRVRSEWPPEAVDGTYLNSGSCGVKPSCVLRAIENGNARLNRNPTRLTFIDEDPWQNARAAAAELFQVSVEDLMLTPNSTFGIQMIMQSCLLNPGDELIITDQEHNCVNVLARYLEENRGIIVRRHDIDPFAGSAALCRGILDLASAKTRLVLVSEINCLTGWRPDLSTLVSELANAAIPLLVDGAHVPGQGPAHIADYAFWVASGHKWMGAPNGCGFLYVKPEYKSILRPLTVGDRLHNETFPAMHRLEWSGTCDVVRLLGLEAAIRLQLDLGPSKIAERQKELHLYLRTAMQRELPAGTIRTPWVENETSALFSIYWNENQLTVPDLREALYQNHRIWTQPDFALLTPGHGMRISCNIFNTEEEIDKLVQALRHYIRPN